MVVNSGYFSRFQRTKRRFADQAKHNADYALAYALLCLVEAQAENSENDNNAEMSEMLKEMRTIRRIGMFNSFRRGC